MSCKTVVLNNTNNGSNKTYQVSIQEEGGGYIVNFGYGKVGAALRYGTKTNAPVEKKKAESIFEKLVKSKIAKGYLPENSLGEEINLVEKEHSGFYCQLLNPLKENELEKYLKDDNYVLQRKYDGEHRALKVECGNVTGINRKGFVVPVETKLASQFELINSALIDGELVGSSMFVFDLLEFNGRDLRNEPYHKRFSLLSFLTKCTINSPEVRLVESYHGYEAKNNAYLKFKQQGREGVVFKHNEAVFSEGRPASGGTQMKYKFYKSISAIVAEINDKRSVRLEVLANETKVSVGNVTIPANHDIPQCGDIVEVRYLYAFPESNQLFQPTYLGKRFDLDATDCNLNQLEYKVGETH